MADDIKKVEIQIATTYDGSGAKKGAEDLEALGAAAKKTGANQYDLSHDLGEVEKRIEGTSGQGREMYRIFSELDRVVPGLGEGLRGLVTGPLGMLGALIFGLAEAKEAWDAYDKQLEKILGEDLTGGIDKATALATAFTGIADAVAKANADFGSAQEIQDRALKNIQGQLEFTRQLIAAETDLALKRLENQKAAGQVSDSDYESKKAAIEGSKKTADSQAEQNALQAELAQKVNAANNAKAQAAAAARKAAAFHLPLDGADNKNANAEAAAEGDVANSTRARGEGEKLSSAQFQDTQTTMHGLGGIEAGLMTPGFWRYAADQIMNHGLKAWDYSGAEYGSKTAAAGKSDISTANAQDAEKQRLEDQIKQRDKAREDAARLSGDAAKAQNEAAWESNPNNAGSLAAKIQQQKNLESINNQSAAVAENINHLGGAVAKALQHAATVAAIHTAVIAQHSARLQALSETSARIGNAANSPP